MTLQKINGGWLSDKDSKFEEVASGKITEYGIDLYFIANTKIDPINGESQVSYYSYINEGYGACFSNDFDSVILYSSLKGAEEMARFMAGHLTVHHKIINREGVHNGV